MIMSRVPSILIKISSFLMISLIVGIFILYNKNERLKDEISIQKYNIEVLHNNARRYVTKDSLNAMEVNALRFTLSELKKIRSEDLDLIKSLNVKGWEIKDYSKLSTESNYKIDVPIKISNDSIKCFDYENEWFSLNGCLLGANFKGSFISRDSLILVESIKYKRFLGFLWKTKKIKDIKKDVFSKNPNTEIKNLEHVIIEN